MELFGTKIFDSQLKIKPIEDIVQDAKNKKIDLLTIPGNEATAYLQRLKNRLEDGNRSFYDIEMGKLIGISLSVREGSIQKENDLFISLSGFPLADYLQSNLLITEQYFEVFKKDILSEITNFENLSLANPIVKSISFDRNYLNSLIPEDEKIIYNDLGNLFEKKTVFDKKNVIIKRYKYFDSFVYDLKKPGIVRETHNYNSNNGESEVKFGGSLYALDWTSKEDSFKLLSQLSSEIISFPKSKIEISKTEEMLRFSYDLVTEINDLRYEISENNISPNQAKTNLINLNKGVNEINSYKGFGADFIKEQFQTLLKERGDD